MNRHLLFVALTLPALACGKKAEDAAEKTRAVVSAQVAPVTAQRFTETVDAVGVVVPRAGHVASLAAPAPTRVSRVYVAPGAHVKAGDPLVEFEQAAFDAAAKGADASLAAAEKAEERTRRLADAGVLPRKDAEAAAADLGAARLNAVNARRARELSTLRSPIDGVVTRVSAVLGASVDPAQVMAEVADPSVVDVALTLSPGDATRVRVGAEVELHAAAAASGAAIAAGRIADVAAAVDSSSRGVQARVELRSRTTTVRIGQTLFGRIMVAEHDRAVVVPLEALVPTGEGFKVFVVDAEGIAVSRAVQIGGRTDHAAWITGGVKEGERIVTVGAYGVDDSTKVVTAEGGGRKAEGGGAKTEDERPKSEGKPATAGKKP
jgi:RND family efflux transporter MFP subunit